MKQFLMSGLAVLVAIVLIIPGCKESPKQSAGLGDIKGNVAGMTWSVPKAWSVLPERAMRVATYQVPPAGGDKEAGECAVFFFEGGQGGPLDANIDRWVGQFEGSPQPARSSKEVNGMKVELVKIEGTYAPGATMMQSTEKKENYRLYGAIVEGPQGLVFFKMTGPKNTVAGAEADFDVLVGSISK